MTTVDSWWTGWLLGFSGALWMVAVISWWTVAVIFWWPNGRSLFSLQCQAPFIGAVVPIFCIVSWLWVMGPLHKDLLHQLGHSSLSKQRDIRIATGLSNRPPRGRSSKDLHRLHHTKNNTTTKIGDFCPVALSCKVGHSSFMGDNLKERAQLSIVLQKKRKTGTPVHRITLFLRTFARPFTV